MEDSAYVVELAAGLLYLPVAVYLLHLAGRTGQLPERLLGWNFACTGSSYVLYAVPGALSLEAETPWYLAGRIVYAIGCMLVATFARRVFRPRGRWPGAVVWCCVLACASGIAVSCLVGDPAGFSLADPGFWLEWCAETVPYVWLTVEAVLARTRAMRRLRVGLSDPHLCNRFLLWGLFGALQLSAAVLMLLLYAAYAFVGSFTGHMDVILGGFEIMSIAMVWLAISPPASYRQWIERLADPRHLQTQ